MRPFKFLSRFAAVFVIVAATTYSTGYLARIPDHGRTGGTFHEGAPFTYRASDSSVEWDMDSRERFDATALAANLGLIAFISLVTALQWSRASQPRDPSQPLRLPLGAEPLPPTATARNNPRLRRMAIRSTAALTLTLVGAFMGMGVVFGLLAGWWYGGRLCDQYEMFGHSSHWTAIAARKIGPAVVVASMLATMGVFLHWGIR